MDTQLMDMTTHECKGQLQLLWICKDIIKIKRTDSYESIVWITCTIVLHLPYRQHCKDHVVIWLLRLKEHLEPSSIHFLNRSLKLIFEDERIVKTTATDYILVTLLTKSVRFSQRQRNKCSASWTTLCENMKSPMKPDCLHTDFTCLLGKSMPKNK